MFIDVGILMSFEEVEWIKWGEIIVFWFLMLFGDFEGVGFVVMCVVLFFEDFFVVIVVGGGFGVGVVDLWVVGEVVGEGSGVGFRGEEGGGVVGVWGGEGSVFGEGEKEENGDEVEEGE